AALRPGGPPVALPGPDRGASRPEPPGRVVHRGGERGGAPTPPPAERGQTGRRSSGVRPRPEPFPASPGSRHVPDDPASVSNHRPAWRLGPLSPPSILPSRRFLAFRTPAATHP